MIVWGDEINWYGEYITVSVTSENNTLWYSDVLIRFLYVNETSVQVAVSVLDNNMHNITIILYDFYDPENNTVLSKDTDDSVEWIVSVWSDKTVARVFIDDNEYSLVMFQYMGNPEIEGLFPSEYKNIMPLIPVALLLALTGRGSGKDAGLGLIAYGIISPLLIKLGFNPQVFLVLSPIAIILGALILFKQGSEWG